MQFAGPGPGFRHNGRMDEILIHNSTVDQAYIDSHSDMRSFFPSPQHLMYTLAELFPSLPHSHNSITLQFSLSAAKINVQKEYLLQLREDEARQHQMLLNQLASLKQQREEEAKLQERTITQLKEELQGETAKRQ